MFFGSGSFRPDTPEGEHTLAHEIAHTGQAGGAVQRIQRAYNLKEKKPLGVETTTEMTTVGDRQVWFLGDGTDKVVVKLEDQPLGLNQMATHLHSKLSPASVVKSKKLISADRTAVRQLIQQAAVTAGNGWSKASSGALKKADFNDDNAYGRAVHLAKIDSSTDPMIAMTVADGQKASDMADPSLSFEQDGMAPIKKILQEPKMLRQLGELTATDLFVGGGLGRRGRQRGEAGEAIGVLGDGAREGVVRLARQRDRGVGIEVLDARRGVADDLKVDAGLVHGGQAALAEVGEVRLQRRARGRVGVAQGADRRRDVGGPEVVFDADDGSPSCDPSRAAVSRALRGGRCPGPVRALSSPAFDLSSGWSVCGRGAGAGGRARGEGGGGPGGRRAGD